jgi:hypothetical protein
LNNEILGWFFFVLILCLAPVATIFLTIDKGSWVIILAFLSFSLVYLLASLASFASEYIVLKIFPLSSYEEIKKEISKIFVMFLSLAESVAVLIPSLIAHFIL